MSQQEPEDKEITTPGTYGIEQPTIFPPYQPSGYLSPYQQPGSYPPPAPYVSPPGIAPEPPNRNTRRDQEIYQKMLALPPEEQKEIVIRAMGTLSAKDKDEIIQQTGVQPLSREATDFIWKVVISGAVAVFVGSAASVIVAVFVKVDVAPLITVFTAAIAFIGGFLAPSPVHSTIRSIASSFKSSPKVADQ